jgi:hypothetical protein
MQDLVSVIKIFGCSLVVIVLMQLKVSNDTLENHFEGWIQHSTIPTYLQNVADGAIKLGGEGISVVTEYTHDRFNIPARWKPLSPAPKKSTAVRLSRPVVESATSDEEQD